MNNNKNMKIVKEYCEPIKKCVLRTHSYSHTIGHFKSLLDEAKKDFPNLNEDEVQIVQFTGRCYARTYGIEFNTEEIPNEEYMRVQKPEYTF